MNILTTISTAISAFIATNLDDLVVLILLFSQANLLRQQIVWGQYLGFGLLLLASLPGFFGSLLLPPTWVGLLGIVPFILGLNRLLEPQIPQIVEEPTEPTVEPFKLGSRLAYLSPQTYSVALITVVNGSDNIAIYLPLFAHCTGLTLMLTLAIFLMLVGVWCYAADRLTHSPLAANLLTRYGEPSVPYLLIALGVMILWESQTLMDRGLAVIALAISLGYLVYISQRLKLAQ